MIYRAINGLIRHAIEADLITNDDIFVVRNQLMDILKLTDWNDKEPLTGNIEELLEPLIDYAVKAGIIEDTAVQRDLFDTRVMGVFTPMPREVNATFQRKYSASPSAATEWYVFLQKTGRLWQLRALIFCQSGEHIRMKRLEFLQKQTEFRIIQLLQLQEQLLPDLNATWY